MLPGFGGYINVQKRGAMRVDRMYIKVKEHVGSVTRYMKVIEYTETWSNRSVV